MGSEDRPTADFCSWSARGSGRGKACAVVPLEPWPVLPETRSGPLRFSPRPTVTPDLRMPGRTQTKDLLATHGTASALVHGVLSAIRPHGAKASRGPRARRDVPSYAAGYLSTARTNQRGSSHRSTGQIVLCCLIRPGGAAPGRGEAGDPKRSGIEKIAEGQLSL
jgi:hypothetical protein